MEWFAISKEKTVCFFICIKKNVFLYQLKLKEKPKKTSNILNNLPIYSTTQIESNSKIQYLFESVGIKTLIKAIEYTPVAKLSGRTVFNLGFGDFDENLGTIVDDINSNNGDIYIVFNTVLSTVPMFFENNKDAVIIVSGSDSNDDFATNCKLTCKKKCESNCKNYQRRIKTYRYFVDKNFEELSQDYIFFGRIKAKSDSFVQYIPKHEYEDILVYKKK